METFYYAYKRDKAQIGDTDGHEVLIDTNPNRPLLMMLIKDGLRRGQGDIIRICEDRDIPLKSPARVAIEQRGATIEVIGLGNARSKGRPPAFSDERELQEIREIWNTPWSKREATRLICDKLGRDVTSRTLDKYLGARDFTAFK